MRKKNKQEDEIEYYSSVRTFRVINDCKIALVIIDAIKGFTNHDRNIIRYVIDNGKGLVLVINKWDKIKKQTNTIKEFTDEIDDWVIEEFRKVGLDTAKSILELEAEDLVKRTDLEEETVMDVLKILKKEFED